MSRDYIYGKEVMISQKSMMNVNTWKNDSNKKIYITHILRKKSEEFNIWGKLKGKVFCIVYQGADEELHPDAKKNVCFKKDCLVSTNDGRVLFWSKIKMKQFKPSKQQSSGTGHNKNMFIFKKHTFCAKDKGHKYSGSQ